MSKGIDSSTQKGIKSLVAAFVLLISTSFSISPAMAGGYSSVVRAQRLTFASDPMGLHLVSVQEVPSRRMANEAADEGSLELTVVEKASGETICRRVLADPFLVHADEVVNNTLTGGQADLANQHFSVVIPVVDPDHQVKVIRKSAEKGDQLVAQLDGREIETSHQSGSRTTNSALTAEMVYQTGDPANRLDILVMGDGYTDSEMALFDEHVNNVVDGLLANEPFSRFASFINVHKLAVASNDSGTDQPDQAPPIAVDTAFNSSFNYAGVPQLLYAQTSLVLEAAAVVPEYDTIILVVNTPRYGGGAGAMAVFAGGSTSAVRVMLHEFGHSFGGLTDEYQQPYDTYTGSEPSAPNCTTLNWFEMAGMDAKWHHWLGVEEVGLFEGCEYYAHGKYRPAENCIMRSLDAGFDPVCREQLTLIIFEHAALVDSYEPVAGEVTLTNEAQPFLLRTVLDDMEVQWYLDGELLTGVQGSQCLLDPQTMTHGEHLLEAVITLVDSWVLSDADEVLTQKVSWTVVRETALQAFRVSLQVQPDVTVGHRLMSQLAIENISSSRQSFRARIDVVRCDGSRVNGYRRGSGSIGAGDERRINLPIHIPAQVPAEMLECPMGLELVVGDPAVSGSDQAVAGSFTIHAD